MLRKTMPKIDIFKGLKKPQIDELLTWFQKQSHKAHDYLFQEGDESDGLYVLCQGTVGVVKSSAKGKFRLAKLDAPSFFGEMSLLNDASRSATIRAQTNVLVGYLPKDTFESMLEEQNSTALLVTVNLARLLSARLEKADKDLANLAARLARRQVRKEE
jgi:CRP-like cAMP-binding protein